MVGKNAIRTRPCSFIYGDETIPYERVPRSGEVNKILIKVHADCRVVVHAPEIATDHDVLKAIQKRSRWVYQQLRAFRQQKEFITPRRYISGESHYYLGKQYLLKVIENDDVPSVKLLRGKFEVYVSRKDAGDIKEELDNWYKAKAKIVFLKRLEHVLDRALWVTEKPKFRVIKMQTQWGSCSPQGTLVLNPYLVKAPTQCIDYVILHELCHLAEHNHSERFYQLMNQVMPDWESRKELLDNMAARLFS
ncbi:M48 family metallopeptidase [Acinetobacter soli]|uniref:M48 family metallopeptidase n=1 Tax=Acinetobacter soli TaxID=487316 RepID=UPI001ABBE9C6|nr:SprT family zinc-dependent metalloprotease [Acinetobacter soli]MBO3672052.1 M48 family metallopeptidase [Acinetobacter soli]